MGEGQDCDNGDKDRLAREPPHRRAPRRSRSPYPHAVTTSPSDGGSTTNHTAIVSSPLQALAERSTNLQAQAPLAPSSNKTSIRPNEPIKRSSIRWNKNLPVPDRKHPTPSVGVNHSPILSVVQNVSLSTSDQLAGKPQSVQASEDGMNRSAISIQPMAFGRPSTPLICPYGENTGIGNLEDGDLQSERGSSWEVSLDGDETSGDECQPIRVKGAENSFFLPPSPWVAEWFERVRKEAVLPITVDISRVHEDFDILPETGALSAKEPYPTTYVDFEEQQSMDKMLRHRRQHKTSEWLIFRELASRNRKKEREKQRQKEQERFRASVRTSRQQALARRTIQRTATATRRGPLGDCILRPALLSDAKDCVDIYNLAVKGLATLPDTNPVSIQRLESIFNDCKHEKLPFVVAAVQRADLTDARNWPSLNAYRQYMNWKQTHSMEDDSIEANIYGFAFLTSYDKGLSFEIGAATEAVKAVVFVHPEYRRNGIGSALLHRLLTQTSIMFHDDIQYEWSDPAVIADSFYIPEFRPIHRIIMHVMVGTDNKKLEWMDKFMKSFQFDKAGCLNQVYKVAKPQGVDWYDQVIWVHWANKINTGQTLYAADESECSYDYPGKSQSPVLPGAELCVVPKDFPNGPDYESDEVDSY